MKWKRTGSRSFAARPGMVSKEENWNHKRGIPYSCTRWRHKKPPRKRACPRSNESLPLGGHPRHRVFLSSLMTLTRWRRRNLITTHLLEFCLYWSKVVVSLWFQEQHSFFWAKLAASSWTSSCVLETMMVGLEGLEDGSKPSSELEEWQNLSFAMNAMM